LKRGKADQPPVEPGCGKKSGGGRGGDRGPRSGKQKRQCLASFEKGKKNTKKKARRRPPQRDEKKKWPSALSQKEGSLKGRKNKKKKSGGEAAMGIDRKDLENCEQGDFTQKLLKLDKKRKEREKKGKRVPVWGHAKRKGKTGKTNYR